MSRWCWILCLALAGCTGTLEWTVDDGQADAGPGRPPPSFVDAGPYIPGVDSGPGVLPIGDAGPAPTPDAGGPPQIVWKGVMIAGDNSITAFDNAREELTNMFLADGVASENLTQLSRREAGGAILNTSADNIERALTDLNIGDGDGCIIHMTSHGSRQGFYIEGQPTLSPSSFDQILDNTCGTRPTVVLISACYSGVFVDDVAAPNRIILTAAREDRTSFGCSAEATYTYWDGCLIDNFTEARTWSELYETVTKCIERKEGGGFTPSMPQVSLGDEVRDMPIFYRDAAY